jgi:hypothetical protein
MSVVKKEAIRHAVGLLGVGLLMSATWMQGYRSAAAKTQVQTVVRSESARGDAEAELARARKQVQVLKDLVVRYQEELGWVDEQHAKGGRNER